MDASVAEISRALGDLGAEGVALMTSVAGVLVSDPRMLPVWAELDRRRAVVLLHPSPGASTAHRSTTDVGAWIDFPTETTRAAAALVLGGVLREFPSVSVILPHAGGFLPYQSGRFEALAALRAVDGADDVPAALRSFCFDTSLAAAPALRGLLAFADPRRVLFGTDLPAAPPAAAEDLAAELDDVFADTWSHAVGGAPLGDAVSRENALRLLPHLAARIRGDRTEEGSR